MTISELYENTGSDFEDVLQRLLQESRVEKFTRMFPDDPSYKDLEAGLNDNDTKEAFRAAHTLKGVCLNMGFTRLYKSVNEITEALRHADPDSESDMKNIHALMEPLRKDYQEIIEAVRLLDA